MVKEAEKKELTLQLISLPIIFLAAWTAFAYFTAPVIVPLVISIALAYVLLPVVKLITRFKVPHTVAVLIIMLVVVGIFVLVSMLLAGQFQELAAAIPGYLDKAANTIGKWSPRLGDTVKSYINNLHHPENLPVDTGKISFVGRFLLKGVTSITNFILGVVSIFFLVLFILLEAPLFSRKLKKIFGEKYAEATQTVLDEVDEQLRGFIQVRFYILIGLAIVTTVGLLLLKVPYAYIWGPMAGILNIIPYIGSIVASVIPVIVVGLQTGSILQMLYVTIFFVAVQTLEGNYITPKLTSDSVDLNGVTVLVSLIYWGWLWGGLGLILAVPVTAAVKVICDHVEPLRPLGIIMGTERKDIVTKAIDIEP